MKKITASHKKSAGDVDVIGTGTDASWAQIGENVQAALSITRRGDREKIVSAFAMSYNTYENRIRKATSAYEYAIGVNDKRLRRDLLIQDLSLVDIIGLWASHDAAAALTAARELVDGKHTFRSLLEAERRARPKSKSTVSSRSQAWHDAASDVLLGGVLRGYRVAAAPAGLADSRLDLWCRKGSDLVAVRLLGPYPNQRDYNRNSMTWVLAGLGLASLGLTSWIVMPIGTAGDRYKKNAERLAPGVLKIVEIALPAYADL